MAGTSVTGLVVVGDIFSDYVCDLNSEERFFADPVIDDMDMPSRIIESVGGNAVQLAMAAKQAGFDPVHVIGKIGLTAQGSPDAPAMAACRTLADVDAEFLFAADPDHSTGRAMVTYLPGDRRFMVYDAGANACFDENDIDGRMAKAISKARLLHVSGYALVQPARRRAVGALMDVARQAGTEIVIDVVPHEIDRFVERDDLLSDLQGADWIMSAESTARRVIAPGEEIDLAGVLDRLAKLADHVALFSSPGEAVVVNGGTCERRTFDYLPGVASRGQSARAQAVLMADYALRKVTSA